MDLCSLSIYNPGHLVLHFNVSNLPKGDLLFTSDCFDLFSNSHTTYNFWQMIPKCYVWNSTSFFEMALQVP